jgi:hypothetical protein
MYQRVGCRGGDGLCQMDYPDQNENDNPLSSAPSLGMEHCWNDLSRTAEPQNFWQARPIQFCSSKELKKWARATKLSKDQCPSTHKSNEKHFFIHMSSILA